MCPHDRPAPPLAISHTHLLSPLANLPSCKKIFKAAAVAFRTASGFCCVVDFTCVQSERRKCEYKFWQAGASSAVCSHLALDELLAAGANRVRARAPRQRCRSPLPGSRNRASGSRKSVSAARAEPCEPGLAPIGGSSHSRRRGTILGALEQEEGMGELTEVVERPQKR